MFIYKITGVEFCVTLRKYQDVTIAANDAAVYTQCLRHHKKLILTAILLKLSQINLRVICIQKIQNKGFDENYAKGLFCMARLICFMYVFSLPGHKCMETYFPTPVLSPLSSSGDKSF